MAQTKTKPKAKTKGKAKAKPKAKKAAAPKRRKTSPNPKANGSTVRHVAEDASDKAKSAGKTVGKAASKAKLPLVAGGAALAGAAGGLALASSKQARKSGLGKAISRRPKIKVKSGDVARAAKEVGKVSTQVGELAGELQRNREEANGKHRSPVEVVLQGLTSRR